MLKFRKKCDYLDLEDKIVGEISTMYENELDSEIKEIMRRECLIRRILAAKIWSKMGNTGHEKYDYEEPKEEAMKEEPDFYLREEVTIGGVKFASVVNKDNCIMLRVFGDGDLTFREIAWLYDFLGDMLAQ